jgi:hypothetical protein
MTLWKVELLPAPFDLVPLTCYKNWFCVEPARGTIRSLTAGFLAQNIRRGQA